MIKHDRLLIAVPRIKENIRISGKHKEIEKKYIYKKMILGIGYEPEWEQWNSSNLFFTPKKN